MSERLTLTNSACRNWLDWAIGSLSANAYLYVGLYKSSFEPDCDAKMADFVSNECVFDGYGRLASYASGTAFDVDDCLVRRSFSSVHFQFNNPSEPDPPADTDTAGGYFVLNYTQSVLVGYGVFDSPVAFNNNACTKDVHFNPCLSDGCGA